MNSLATKDNWTPERVDTAKAMWGDGKSAAEIARHLDCGISRSAVLGKMNRLGLSKPARRASYRALSVPSRVLAPRPINEPGIDVTNRIGFLQAADDEGCLWCDGDPLTADHSFCGKPRIPGHRWCAEHYRRVYPAR